MNDMDDFLFEEFESSKKRTRFFVILGLVLLVVVGYFIYMYVSGYDNNNVSIINFNTDGGTFVTAQNIASDQKITKPEDPIKENYVFVEWQLDGKTFDFDKPIDKNATLVAIWKEVMCLVSFDSNGGSEVSKIEIAKGSNITKPANPTKSGYSFKYWSSNDKEFDFSQKIIEDLTLKANWEKIVYNNTNNNVDETNNNDSKDALVNYLKSVGFDCSESCSKIEESGGLSFSYIFRFSSNTFKYTIQSSGLNVNFTYNYSTNISEGYVNSTKYIYNVATDTVTSSGLIVTGGGATHARASVTEFKGYLAFSYVSREDIIE